MNQRREFLKKSLLAAVGTAVVLPALRAQGQEKRRGGGGAGGDLPLVQPGQGMAANVNYQHKNSDIKDAKLKVDRQGVPFAKQTCASCMLYTKHGMMGGEEVGKCTLFPNQVVKGAGWCGSWAKKT